MSGPTINDGGPAYPSPAMSQNQTTGETVCHQSESGMTLRDYFAAKAMQGFAADPTNHQVFTDHADAARSAYLLADAMLKARQS